MQGGKLNLTSDEYTASRKFGAYPSSSNCQEKYLPRLIPSSAFIFRNSPRFCGWLMNRTLGSLIPKGSADRVAWVLSLPTMTSKSENVCTRIEANVCFNSSGRL